MARTVKDTNLGTRASREKLPARKKPYWRTIDPGRHLGYYRGERGGTWIARRYIGDGKYDERRLGIADDTHDADGAEVLTFGQAQERARAWFTQQAAPAAGGPLTVLQARDSYIEYLKAERRSGDDAERRLKRTVPDESALAKKAVVGLVKADIEKWRNGLVKRDKSDPEVERRSRDTANRELTMLKAALNRAFNDEANAIPSDAAWRRVKPFKDVGRSRMLALDAAQRKRLINATDGAFRNLVIATLFTGSRPAPGEVASARVRDLHVDIGVITIAGKTGQRSVPLTAEAAAWFKSIAAGKHPDALLLPKDDGTAWGTGHQLRPMREARGRAKLPEETTLYTLRHTFASEHIMGGTDLVTLADIMGTSVRMLEDHYAHIIAAHKRKVVEAAGFKLGVRPRNVSQMRPRKGA